jgi:hypothetical protein
MNKRLSEPFTESYIQPNSSLIPHPFLEERLMPRQLMAENRIGQRYVATLPVRAAWTDEAGEHVVEGTTENVGPEGTLVHLQRELPKVGSRVQLVVHSEEGHELQVVTEVLRLERAGLGARRAALYSACQPGDGRRRGLGRGLDSLSLPLMGQ